MGINPGLTGYPAYLPFLTGVSLIICEFNRCMVELPKRLVVLICI